MKALLRRAGLKRGDMVYTNFENRWKRMPYCIVVDHRWKSAVGSVSGSLSLEDCVMDVLSDVQSLGELGRKYGFDGERGVLSQQDIGGRGRGIF